MITSTVEIEVQAKAPKIKDDAYQSCYSESVKTGNELKLSEVSDDTISTAKVADVFCYRSTVTSSCILLRKLRTKVSTTLTSFPKLI